MKKILIAPALTILLLVLLCTTSSAIPIAVSNHSFEGPVKADGGITNGGIDDWTTGGLLNAGVWNPSVSQTSAAFIAGIPEGDQVAYSNGADIEQILGETLQAGFTYTLSVWIGGRDLAHFVGEEYEIILLAGSSALATGTGVNVADTWFKETVTYYASAGDPLLGQLLKIQLVNTNEGIQLNFDNVTLTKTVPEPATMLLLGTGFIGLAVLGRKRFLKK